MKKSKLILLLNSFSRKEWRSFQRFVRSPYLNLRDDVIELLDYLQECLLDLKIEPTKKTAFIRLYPKEVFNDHKVRVAMSNLFKLAEAFVAWEQQIDAPTDYLKLAQDFRRRGLEKHLAKAIEQARKEQNQKEHKDAAYYLQEYYLQKEIYEQQAARKRSEPLNFETSFEALDSFYLIQKLQQACFARSHQQVYKHQYDYGLLHPLLEYIQNTHLRKNPAIAIYYHCFLALTDSKEPSHFRELKKYLLREEQVFEHAEMRDLFLLATNFCLRQHNEGNSAYLPDLLELYQEGLDKGYLLKEGQLSRFTFRNMVTLGLIQKEYEWVEQFIHKYKSKLEEKYQESMAGLCLARLEYSKKNYDKALELLQKAEYEDLLLNLAAKTVLMKVYFSLDEYDLLEAHLHAMRTFIRRKKIMGYHRDNYLNMIRFMQKILELQLMDVAGKERLRAEINDSKAIVEKEWLLEILR